MKSRLFRKFSLKGKIMLLVSIVTLTVLTLMTGLLIAYESYTFREGVRKNITTTAKIVADRSKSAVLFRDDSALKDTVNALRSNESILLACIYDADVNVLAFFSREAHSNHCPRRPHLTTYKYQNDLLLLEENISLNDELLGAVYLEVSLIDVSTHIKNYLLFTSIVGVIVFVIVYLLTSVLQSHISDPLVQLKVVARRIAKNRDYSLRAEKSSRDEIGELVDAFNQMLQEIQNQNAMIIENSETLEAEINERTRELKNTNAELEAFSYSVSHDLRAPIRAIVGFTQALIEDCGEQLDDIALDHISRVTTAGHKMDELITSLLHLSRVTRKAINEQPVDLSALAAESLKTLADANPDRKTQITIQHGMADIGDIKLLRVVMDNLLGNAWKYTQKEKQPAIEFGRIQESNTTVYFVRDNGAGFDMNHQNRLFTAFQRLHTDDEFEGTGIGLATVARIIHRHHGDIWATSTVGEGSTFFFTLHQQGHNGNENNTKTASTPTVLA
jgi:signal transduction histidine kinase